MSETNSFIEIDQSNRLSQVLKRITEIDIKLASMSYSQSDPGKMMDRRMLRKEKDKLENELDMIHSKKKD